MANFSKKEKKIYDGLKYKEKILLLNHGLQKLLSWSIIFLTVIVSFLQIILLSQPLPKETNSLSEIIQYVIEHPLWILGFFLIFVIVGVINKFFISYEHQLIWEYNFPGNLYKILWRQPQRPIGNFFFNHDLSDKKAEFMKEKRVKYCLIVSFIGLIWIYFFRFFENHSIINMILEIFI